MTVKKFVEAISSGMNFSVRQDLPISKLGDIRALRFCQTWTWIETCPSSMKSFLELQRVHECVTRGKFYEHPTGHDHMLVFAMPGPAYKWFKTHTFNELVQQWVEAAARYANVNPRYEQVVIDQTPETIVDDVRNRIAVLRDRKAQRRPLPGWLRPKHAGNYREFVKEYNFQCYSWGVNDDDLARCHIDDIADRYESDTEAFTFWRFHQAGPAWPTVKIRMDQTPVGFIYLLFDGENYKIGYASSSPSQRLRSCQTGNARSLSLVGQVPGTPEKERLLHAFFAEKRLHGEWFALDQRDVQYILGRAVPE